MWPYAQGRARVPSALIGSHTSTEEGIGKELLQGWYPQLCELLTTNQYVCVHVGLCTCDMVCYDWGFTYRVKTCFCYIWVVLLMVCLGAWISYRYYLLAYYIT